MSSFDGTKIVLNWFPAKDGVKAPTVLFGPGWAQAGSDDPEAASSKAVGSIGPGPLRKAGYNVLTWDPRGFGDSEGTATVDNPDAEGRDVQALLDYVAKQPEAALDAPGDPRVGMTGASYGGEIQLVTAAIDSRLDAIVPDIAWNSLTTSLYKDGTFKTGWGSLLFGFGQVQGTLDSHIQTAAASGLATGTISAEDEAWFASRGASKILKQVKIPTLLVQGTVDTLFTLQEAISNHETLTASGVPLKMLWFCGGHGACLGDDGDQGRVERLAIRWLDRWLKGDTTLDTGPAFEWVDQTGAEHTAVSWPPAPATALTASGSGVLPITNLGGSGPTAPKSLPTGADIASVVALVSGPTNGTRATNAVNVPVTAKDGALVVGAPKVTFTYSGVAAISDARVYGQLVDDATGLVLGNVVTPIPVALDGAEHTVTRPLEPVAASLKPGASLTFQLVSSTTAYETLQQNLGAMTVSKLSLTVPTADPKTMNVAALPKGAATLHLVRARGTGRVVRVTLRARGGTLRGVRIVVRTARGRVLGTKRIGTLRGTRTFSVRLGRRAGKTARVTATATSAGKPVSVTRRVSAAAR